MQFGEWFFLFTLDRVQFFLLKRQYILALTFLK
jgi:hypothetical protein